MRRHNNGRSLGPDFALAASLLHDQPAQHNEIDWR
jgi:hypothetical protein